MNYSLVYLARTGTFQPSHRKKTCSENVKVGLFLISTTAASAGSNNRIHRAELTDGIEVIKWSVACGPRGLSVNKAHNVFVAYWKHISAGNQFSVHMRIAMDQHVLLSMKMTSFCTQKSMDFVRTHSPNKPLE